MEKIILWYKLNEATNEYEYNHFSFNTRNRKRPVPEAPDQLVWNKSQWKSKVAYIGPNRIVTYRSTIVLKFIFWLIWTILLITAFVFGVAGISAIFCK